MSLTKMRFFAITSLAVFLTACGDSGLDKKSGKTLYQEATQQLYAKDAQFNFNANMAVEAEAEAENPMLADLKINISGAINNITKRYEFVPEVEAAIFNFKIPIFIDGKNNEILLNTSNFIDAALMFVPQAKNELKQYKNKFVRFSPDNFEINEDDMAQAMTIASQAAKIGYGVMGEFTQAIPESSIQKLELDDKAKQLDAKAVLKVTLDQQQSEALQKHINTYIYDQVAANEELPEEFKTEFMQALLESDSDSGFESSESVLYLNAKGQIVHDQNVLNYDIEDEKVSVSMTTDYSNYGKASFSVYPEKDQIIEFTEENMRSLQQM